MPYYINSPTTKTTCIGNALSSFNFNFSNLDTNLYQLSSYTVNSVNYLSSSLVSVSAKLTSSINYLSASIISVSSNLITQMSNTSALLFNQVNYVSANVINNYITQGTLYTPTGGGTVNWNFSTVGTNAKIYLTGGNITLANPTGLLAGQSGNLVVELSSTAGLKISGYGDKWKFPNSLSSMSTAASSVNLINFYYDGRSLLSTMTSGY